MAYSQLPNSNSSQELEPSVIVNTPTPPSRKEELKKMSYRQKLLGFGVRKIFVEIEFYFLFFFAKLVKLICIDFRISTKLFQTREGLKRIFKFPNNFSFQAIFDIDKPLCQLT